MSPAEIVLRAKLRDDLPFFAEKCLKIRAKDGKIVPLALNKAQLYLHQRLEQHLAETGMVRALIVKGRKQGVSTYIAGRHYHKVTHQVGFKAFILTHLADATANLFAMVERFHERNSPFLKPRTGASNKTELLFPGLDGGYGVGTAGSANVGRSDTIQLFHGSEVAFWPHAEDHASGILEAVPDEPGTEIVLESTTNGPMGFFAEEWTKAVAGVSKYIAIFIPWFWTEEYRAKPPADFERTKEEEELAEAHGLDDAQLQWRREKINGPLKSADKFMQEYPSTPEEAFQTSGEGCYIPPVLVAKARRTKVVVTNYIPIILGIDVARGGRDRSSIIDRQGRRAGGNIYEYWDEANAERFCSKIVQVIKRIKPKKVCIDATEGLGGALCDMLNELGYSSKPGKGQLIVPVKFSEAALEDEIYLNRRAELSAQLKAWLENPLGVQLPDDDMLQAEICAAVWGPNATRHTRNGRLQIESKEQIIARLKRSPDGYDALINTFAAPIIAAKPEMPVISGQHAADPSVNY